MKKTILTAKDILKITIQYAEIQDEQPISYILIEKTDGTNTQYIPFLNSFCIAELARTNEN